MDTESSHFLPPRHHVQEGKGKPARPPFCRRFDIHLDLEEVQQHFLNRIKDGMDSYIWGMGYRSISDMV